jgi:hypothetical protein
MDQGSLAALCGLVVLVLVVIFLLMIFESGSSSKAAKAPSDNIRRVGQETRAVMSKARDDYVIQELMLLSGERARKVLSGHQSTMVSETVSCPNPTCAAYGQMQSESSRQNVIKHGRTSAGSQRYRCKTCGKTFIRS